MSASKLSWPHPSLSVIHSAAAMPAAVVLSRDRRRLQFSNKSRPLQRHAGRNSPSERARVPPGLSLSSPSSAGSPSPPSCAHTCVCAQRSCWPWVGPPSAWQRRLRRSPAYRQWPGPWRPPPSYPGACKHTGKNKHAHRRNQIKQNMSRSNACRLPRPTKLELSGGPAQTQPSSQCTGGIHHGGLRNVLVGLPSPLVRLCRVWVDADCSVTVPLGCVGLLHLDVDAGDMGDKLVGFSAATMPPTCFAVGFLCVRLWWLLRFSELCATAQILLVDKRRGSGHTWLGSLIKSTTKRRRTWSWVLLLPCVKTSLASSQLLLCFVYFSRTVTL